METDKSNFRQQRWKTKKKNIHSQPLGNFWQMKWKTWDRHWPVERSLISHHIYYIMPFGFRKNSSSFIFRLGGRKKNVDYVVVSTSLEYLKCFDYILCLLHRIPEDEVMSSSYVCWANELHLPSNLTWVVGLQLETIVIYEVSHCKNFILFLPFCSYILYYDDPIFSKHSSPETYGPWTTTITIFHLFWAICWAFILCSFFLSFFYSPRKKQ